MRTFNRAVMTEFGEPVARIRRSGAGGLGCCIPSLNVVFSGIGICGCESVAWRITRDLTLSGSYTLAWDGSAYWTLADAAEITVDTYSDPDCLNLDSSTTYPVSLLAYCSGGGYGISADFALGGVFFGAGNLDGIAPNQLDNCNATSVFAIGGTATASIA